MKTDFGFAELLGYVATGVDSRNPDLKPNLKSRMFKTEKEMHGKL